MTPINIQAQRDQATLKIDWGDEQQSVFSFWNLRCACRCARCVDEMTGKQILDPQTVPSDIQLESAELVGNYALRIRWSDGHDTGLFTWDHFAELSKSSQSDDRG